MKENWVYRRGDIYLANLGVPIGSKQGGVRPVVVLQNDVGNFYSPTITVAPLTTKIQKKRSQPTHYFLRKAKGLARSSMVFPYPHRLPAFPGNAHGQRAGRCGQDYSPRPGGVSARQGPGTAAIHHQQSQAAAEPQAPDRRHPADDGGQPNQFCERNRRPAAGDLRQQN